MENFYTSYAKVIQGKTYYFIKKYLTFPEFKNVPDVLVGYGMHTDFDKACSIATIHDASVREQLLNNISENPEQAKVIEMRPINLDMKSSAG